MTYKAATHLFSLAAFIFSSFTCLSQQEKINIGIFAGKKITKVLLAPASEVYSIVADEKMITLLNRNDVLSISYLNDSLELKTISKRLGRFKSIKITALSELASLKVKAIEPSAAEINYDGDMLIRCDNYSMSIVNSANLDKYVASVVEAETGYSAPQEYYKIQAIMCRTFALESKGKHKSEGYDLCDRQHCQVYQGKSNKKPEIKLAVAATSGIVLVDSTNRVIFAAYHSNCGGQTDFSENVWKTERTYLKPVTDTFCIHSRNAKWEKIITLPDWEKYLIKQNKDFSRPADSLYCFYQPQRKRNYELFGSKISLNQMRKDLKLHSTFFDVEQDSGSIIISGRGSGHGVGLCQQGAIEMARQGFSYKKILGYYYKGVRLVEYTKVK